MPSQSSREISRKKTKGATVNTLVRSKRFQSKEATRGLCKYKCKRIVNEFYYLLIKDSGKSSCVKVGNALTSSVKSSGSKGKYGEVLHCF